MFQLPIIDVCSSKLGERPQPFSSLLFPLIGLVQMRPTCICKPLKTGPMCEICERGYYQDPADEFGCLECSCPSVDASQRGACDPRSGACLHCPNGTAGQRCKHCAPGWSGAPPLCHPLAAARARHSGLTLLAAVLAAAAVAVALGLGYWVSHGARKKSCCLTFRCTFSRRVPARKEKASDSRGCRRSKDAKLKSLNVVMATLLPHMRSSPTREK